MKFLKYFASFSFAILIALACNKPSELAPTIAEILKSEASTGIGAEINTTITANGGTAFISSASAKIIVPAGAMPVGATFITQAITDKIDNEGQGISISGNWTKPIIVEFSAAAGEINPNSYKILLRLNNGYWITCTKPKYNASNNTVSVRIAPTSTAGARAGAKILAKKYDLAFAKTFYIKPEKSVLDLGEKVALKAYAREGFVPVKIGKRTFDAEADLIEAIEKFAEASEKLDNDASDDDLVPLTQPAKPSESDDYLMPLITVAEEYEFTNTKTGFTRSWILMDGPGVVNKTGNVGADYIAPKDQTDRGKTAQVSFLSRNDKTKQDVEAQATIRIKDGLTRYSGTVTAEYIRVYGSGSTKYTETIKTKSVVTLANSLGTPTRYETKYYIGKIPSQYLTTTVDEYSVLTSDGSSYRKLSGSCSATGNDAGFLVMYLTKDNIFEFSGWIDVETDKCAVDTYCDNCFPKYGTTTTSFYTDLGDPTTIKLPFTDAKVLSGTFTQKGISAGFTNKITWNLKRED